MQENKKKKELQEKMKHLHEGGCPGSRMRMLEQPEAAESAASAPVQPVSRLRNWPVQIKLAPVHAPYFAGAKLLIAADCTAYAYANFHQEFMRGKVTLIGCPKLDAVDYSEKLTEILRSNDIQSVTILRMEVPCCGGLEMAAKKALQTSGKFIPWQVVTIPLTEKFWTKCGNTDRPSVFDFGLFQGGAGSAHKILHGLHRVLPGGGLPGKHHAGSAVCHGVVDVADLGAGGDRPAAHTVQHLGHHHKGHPGRPADRRKLFLAPGQLPQGHGVAKVPAGNDHFIHKGEELRQGLYPRKALDLGKNADLPGPGLFQRPAQGANVLSPRTKGSITPVTPLAPASCRFCRSSSVNVGEATVSPGAARLLRLCRVPPRTTVHCRAAPSASATCTRSLPSSSRRFWPGRAACTSAAGQGTPPCPSRRLWPGSSTRGWGSVPMRSSGPCRSMSSWGMPRVDDIQPVFVGRKGPVGKVHADARHASFHHALQGLQLGTGGANGTIKFQKITRFRFFLL